MIELPNNVLAVLSRLREHGFVKITELSSPLVKRIRFVRKDFPIDKNHHCYPLFCPLTALCKAMTGAVYTTEKFVLAGGLIGLSPKTCYNLMCAADDPADAERSWLEELLK